MSLVAQLAQGACPNCEATGAVGQPCQERVCQRQGAHFIPFPYAQACWVASNIEREPLVGQYIGDFLILGRIGKGGFGRVLLAVQRPLLRLRAAIKLLEFGGQDEATRRRIVDKFENEAAVLAVLNHPNIVRLLHFGTQNDRPYLAMEYVPNRETLQSMMNRLMVQGASLDPKILRTIIGQVLDGLEAAHREHIIHRDIKPENIVLQEVVGNDYHVKLLDFGLAKFVHERRDTSLVIGTVHYMAPEQIEAKNIGPWTDLYATSCILFEFMTGQRAFPGSDPQEVLRHKLSATHDVFAHVDTSRMPPAAIEFLRRGLARDPVARFQSTAEFRVALDAIFNASASTQLLSADLSRIADSEELTRLRAEQARVDAERRTLEDQRREVDTARKELEVQRQKLTSERLGIPAEVEHAALGGTIALSPLSVPPSDTAIAPPPSAVLGLQTGIPDATTSPTPRRARPIWLIALGALAAGIVALVVLLGRDDTPTVAALAPTTAAAPAPEVSAVVVETSTPDATAPETTVATVALEPADTSAAPVEVIAPEVVPAPAPTLHTVIVSSQPAASIWVDRVARGKTPMTLTWAPDKAAPSIRLVAPGHRPVELTLDAADAERGKREVQLQKMPRQAPTSSFEIEPW